MPNGLPRNKKAAADVRQPRNCGGEGLGKNKSRKRGRESKTTATYLRENKKGERERVSLAIRNSGSLFHQHLVRLCLCRFLHGSPCFACRRRSSVRRGCPPSPRLFPTLNANSAPVALGRGMLAPDPWHNPCLGTGGRLTPLHNYTLARWYGWVPHCRQEARRLEAQHFSHRQRLSVKYIRRRHR